MIALLKLSAGLDFEKTEDRGTFRQRCQDEFGSTDIHVLREMVETRELSRYKVICDIANSYINEVRTNHEPQ